MSVVYLIRHAHVVVSEDVPARDWPLSDDGRRDAERLAASPVWRDVSLVAAGPEPKMVGTAEPIAAAAGRAPRHQPDLREVERGATWTAGAERYRALVQGFFAGESPPGWEPRDRARTRVVSCIERLLDEAAGRVAVMSGGLALTLYLTSFAGTGDAFELWSAIPLPAVAVVDAAARRVVTPFEPAEAFLARSASEMIRADR